ncbi:Uma2 family endonuclease [Amycolatopsis anabasis]|uniref:Uma2 family endonuclease n=1 Tax=Amycolatopsis anabasis TaxID=1840409 RepID=UPI00131B0538|nr:Uma2 family endonuclease [Amycolatopsis anabasis]
MVAPWPDHLVTLDEWDALPEDTSRHYELVEGVLIVSPKPQPTHQRAVQRLASWVDEQLPKDLTAIIDIEITVAQDPPIVRAPDVTIITSHAVDSGRARIDASEVLVAVEIISPGSARTDRLVKPIEYADAGIPAYWLIDLDEPVSLTAYTLTEGDYHVDQEVTGAFTSSFPAAVTVNLTDLTTREVSRSGPGSR